MDYDLFFPCTKDWRVFPEGSRAPAPPMEDGAASDVESAELPATFDLQRAPFEVRRMIYSCVFANGDGRRLCKADPNLCKEALPMSIRRDKRIPRLTIYIEAFDPAHRDDWLVMEWLTDENELFTAMFVHLEHETIRRLMSISGLIHSLHVIIKPEAASDNDLTQVPYLWAKIRDVAFLLGNMKRWDVQNLSIAMHSKGPSGFNLASTPLCQLPIHLACNYNFLAMAHMALLEPLISNKKLGSTHLRWYQDAFPDTDSTPEHMLGLVGIAWGSQDSSPDTLGTVSPIHLNDYYSPSSLERMRAQVLSVTVAFDLHLDNAAGVAACHLRLQRFRVWGGSELCALSLESRSKTMQTLTQSRAHLELLKEHHPEWCYLEAVQDKEFRDLSIRLNQDMHTKLLPSGFSSASTSTATGKEHQAIVAQWTKDKIVQLSDELRFHIDHHEPADKWSSNYPLGVPSLYHIRDQERKRLETSSGIEREEEDEEEEEEEEEGEGNGEEKGDCEIPEELAVLGYTDVYDDDDDECFSNL